MLNKKAKIIISLIYGVVLASLASFTMMETFVFPSAKGALTSNSSKDWYDFDSSAPSSAATSSSDGQSSEESSSLSGTSSSDNESTSSFSESSSSSEAKKETTLSYEEYTYTVSNKKVPYIIVTVNLKKISDFRTRVATNNASQYGTNITQSFESLISEAEEDDGQEVLFAIDGDFPFWSGREGYVIRDGVSYRETKRDDSSNLDLAIYKDGTFRTYDEEDVSFDTLMNQHNGCYQNWSFGPALLVDSNIAVTQDQDVSQTMSANQRVGMGYKDDGTLFFLCSDTNDGKRRGSSVGLSLYNMASIFQDLGCSIAYNFDGGGSANMFIKGYGSDGYYMSQTRELGDIIYVVNS